MHAKADDASTMPGDSTGAVSRWAERAASRPGLEVSVTVRPAHGNGALVHVRVRGAQAPFRVYVYADGELVESWMPGRASNEFVCPAPGPGRHTVTARAIDAAGRWGGATVLYGDPVVHAMPCPADSSRDRGVRCTVAPAKSA